MALKITEECINCDVCVQECPNQAIYSGPQIYVIITDRCTECVGHSGTPQCLAVCPVECIIPDLAALETPDELQLKYQRLLDQGLLLTGM